MTTTFLFNLIAAILIVAAMAWICRTAYRVAGGLLDGRRSSPEQPALDATVEDTERLAA
jgi:hypothetical protein